MLRLTAADTDDLSIISAQMQDAVLKRADLRFDKKRRRFALIANRFAWDALPEKQRRRAGLHFDDVTSVKSTGLTRLPASAVLSLLAITFAPTADWGGTITLSFSTGIHIRLSVTCVNATLADVGASWGAAATPAHKD